MQPGASDFSDIIGVLIAYKVRFLVVGGVGAVLQGAPIATFDLDIVHARSKVNCARLAKALEAIGARYRGHPKIIRPTSDLLRSPGHHLLLTVHGPLDVLGTIGHGRGYSELSKSSICLKLQSGPSVRVLRLSKLIETKQETARDKDRAILSILRQTLAEKRRSQRGGF
jgi:hypothetical protein